MNVLVWKDSAGFVHRMAAHPDTVVEHIEALDRLGYMWHIETRHTDDNVNNQ